MGNGKQAQAEVAKQGTKLPPVLQLRVQGGFSEDRNGSAGSLGVWEIGVRVEETTAGRGTWCHKNREFPK